MTRTVLMVGLDPALVADGASSRAAFPDMDAARIRAGIEASHRTLSERGFTAQACLVDYGRTAEKTFRAALASNHYDVVMIGAGVRLDPALTHLFELLVNVAHELVPGVTLVFNTDPADSADAVLRWVPDRAPLTD